MLIVDDIAYRLYWRKPQWFYGVPEVSVEGKKGSFGKLIFDFHDEVVSYDIYLTMNLDQLKWVAEMALKLFVPLAESFLQQDMRQ